MAVLVRRDVLRFAAALGLGTAIGGCGWFSTDDDVDPIIGLDGPGRVIIVGAGAAGMSAAYLLTRAGADVTVLEAAPSHGGRIKTATDFVDFPIPLGGEWIHTDDQELRRIVDDDTVDVDIPLVPYTEDDVAGFWDGTSLELRSGDPGNDLKLDGATWLTFFDRYLVPAFADRLKVSAPVATIDYDDAGVTVTEQSGEVHEADAVIVTVPITVMREGDISFSPPLPDEKVEAFEDAFVWGGFKMFIEFSEAFYPTYLSIEGSDSSAGQKLWYDAAYGQSSSAHVLGLFTVGDQSEPYQALEGDALRDFALAELDEIFDGAAGRSYLQHISQDWNAEPYVRQAYFADSADWRLPPKMRSPVGNRLYFAGCSYTDGSDWSSVHTAAASARYTVELLATAGVV